MFIMLFLPHIPFIYHDKSENKSASIFAGWMLIKNYFCEKYVSSKTTQPYLNKHPETCFLFYATDRKMQDRFSKGCNGNF